MVPAYWDQWPPVSDEVPSGRPSVAWNKLRQTELDMMSRMMGGGQGGEGEGSGEEEGAGQTLACVGIKVLFKDRLGGAEGTPRLDHAAPALGLSPVPHEAQDGLPDPKPPSHPCLWPLRGRKDVSLPMGDSQNSSVIGSGGSSRAGGPPLFTAAQAPWVSGTER